MQIFLSMMLLLTPLSLLAEVKKPTPIPQTLSRCLGQEEKNWHASQRQGAIYALNQRFIAEVVQLSNIEVKPSYLTQICAPQTYSSLVFLEIIMLHPKDWYHIKDLKSDIQQNIAESLVKDVNEHGTEIFIDLIMGLQSEAPTPHCMEKKIKGLKKFYREIKYLQEEIDLKKIVHNPKRLRFFFSRIKDYKKIFKECSMDLKKQKDLEKKKEEENKKA